MGITVSDYLVLRLQELGVTDFFGLPGDYNFNIVESVENNPDTNWIGCTNELNAGYAADGYARIKGYGAIITTYGVGELSAINAIAGSMSEFVPVVKITGVPSTKNIKENKLIHHNLNAPDYFAFINAYSNVVQTTAFLDSNNAKEEIDRVLSVLIKEKKPVYIALPEDICTLIIDNEPSIQTPKSDRANLELALQEAMKLIDSSKNPAILADVMVKRFDAKEEFNKLLNKTLYPVSTLLMGKDLINDNYCNFSGTYVGASDNPIAYRIINNSDCPISLGIVNSDLNTFGFDLKFNPDDFINVQGTYTIVKNKMYKDVLMKDMIIGLTQRIHKKSTIVHHFEQKKKPLFSNSSKLNSDYLYSRLEEFLEQGDNLICETGLVNFALAKLKLKDDMSVNNQLLWGSIGWATGAALGVSIADKNSRTILITGEGSHQLSAQEISTIMRNNLKPIIIVINNSGYTIERLLACNPMDKFNDIAKWNYSKLPGVFEGEYCSICASTNEEFDLALNIAKKEQRHKMCYIEAKISMFDTPELANKFLNKKNKSYVL